MGNGIPLPALALQQQPQVDPVSRYMAMRQQLQQGQIQAEQLQGTRLENEQRQQALTDQQSMTAAMRDWNGEDINQLPGLVLKRGGSAQAVFGLKQSLVGYQKNLAEMSKDQLANEAQKNDYISGHIDAVKALPVEQQAPAFDAAKADLVKHGYLDPQAAQGLQYQGPDQLDTLEKLFQSHTQQVESTLKGQQTQEAGAKAALDQIKVNLSKNSKPGDFDALIDSAASGPANQALNWRTKGMVNFALQRGDIESANRAITEMSNQFTHSPVGRVRCGI